MTAKYVHTTGQLGSGKSFWIYRGEIALKIRKLQPRTHADVI